MAFDPKILEQAVPPLDPNEGVVQLAMAKGKGKTFSFLDKPMDRPDPVSYTHLTLPTILRV